MTPDQPSEQNCDGSEAGEITDPEAVGEGNQPKTTETESGGEAHGDSASSAARRPDDVSVDVSEREFRIYECIECENIVFTVHTEVEQLSCHGEKMNEIAEWDLTVNPPELRQVLLEAFGLPKVGIDICLCVVGEGPMSPSDVADRLDYDRSTISKYLNQLVDIGLLEKSQLNRKSGGYVNVYHGGNIDRLHREMLVGFYAWAGEAAALIEEANEAKAQYSGEDYSENFHELFWEEFQKES